MKVKAIYEDAPVFEMQKGRFDMSAGMRTFLITGRIVYHRGLHLISSFWKRIVGFDPKELLFAKYEGPDQEGPNCVDIALGAWLENMGRSFYESLVTRDKNADR